MKIEKELADFVVSLQYDDIPAEVIDTIKKLFLDFAGLCYRGAEVESSKPLLELLKHTTQLEGVEDAGEGKSVVAGTGLKAPPEYACLANGSFSHSLELDDVVNEASLHPGVVVFPSALAVGEMTGASGREFITAAVIGYEIMIRLGKAINPVGHYRCGFHPTGTCGIFAAASVAGKLMGLNKKDIVSAFGISTSKTASSLEFLEDGAWTKRLHPGWACHSGFLAARLAGFGFYGPEQGIGGRYGFLNIYSDASRPEKAVEDLKKKYLTLNTSIKPHACCRYNQSPIDAVLEIVNSNNVSPNDIEKVDIEIVGSGMQLVGEPIEDKRNPQNIVDAQFSLPFAVSVAILKGKAFLEEFSDQMINSPEVKDMMKKVNCSRDVGLEEEFPEKWPCRVKIITRKENYFEKKLDYPRGDPQNPISREELLSKFNSLTEGMETEKRREFIDKVNSLEEVERIDEIAALLA